MLEYSPQVYLVIIQARIDAKAIMADPNARPSLVNTAARFLLQWGP